MSEPKYIIERHKHGWLICSSQFGNGVPLSALQETTPLFSQDAVVNSGVAHHLNQTGHLSVCMAVMSPEGSKLWEAEINEQIKHLPVQERWWKGLDVGLSSASIFSVLSTQWRNDAERFCRQSTPQDAADFGRCKRLVDMMEWRARLSEVALAYPTTKWPAIIERWSELESADPIKQSSILQEIHE